jgi:hypothetical protein
VIFVKKILFQSNAILALDFLLSEIFTLPKQFSIKRIRVIRPLLENSPLKMD